MQDFVKEFTSVEAAESALRRSEALRLQGVRTPGANQGAAPYQVAFKRISGGTGIELLDDSLEAMLAQLARLHRADVPGLCPFDPLLRIRSRLALSNAPEIREALQTAVPKGTHLIHGDLHVGQFIRDPYRRIWIVDLDDLAIGPPEADLANFVAHLSTKVATTTLGDWASRIGTIWSDLGFPLDKNIFTTFLRFALIRRHLKLREAGKPDFEAMVRDYLRDSESFSIR